VGVDDAADDAPDDVPWRAPYAPALDRSSKALAAAAVVTEAVELTVGPHRVISAVFLGVGVLVGFAVGRTLARQLREWATDAPALADAEASHVRGTQFSPVSFAALVAIEAVGIVVPLVSHLPTPIPGALAAGAIQALLQRRVLRAIEVKRRGEVLRPVGRLSFDGTELRVR
jgi:hypothetical protein